MVGGVTSWCHALLTGLPGIDWEVLPILAGRKHQRPTLKPPANANYCTRSTYRPRASSAPLVPARQRPGADPQLLRGLMPWEGDLAGLTAALVRCRRSPESIRLDSGRESSRTVVQELERLLLESHRDSAPAPIYDAIEAARLYQALYWVARTAAYRTPGACFTSPRQAGQGFRRSSTRPFTALRYFLPNTASMSARPIWPQFARLPPGQVTGTSRQGLRSG